MTKTTVILILLTMLSGVLLYGEIFTPLNGGEPIASGEIETPLMFRGNSGNLYFAYILNGNLTVKISSDGGGNFKLSHIDYQGVIFTGYSDLKLVKSYYHGNLIFFKAKKNGVSGIFALKIASDGEPVLLHTNSLAGGGGAIGAYSVSLAAPGDYLVAYLQGGNFRISYVEDAAGKVVKRVEVQGVENYTMGLNFSNGNPVFCGIFRRSSNGIDYYQYDLSVLETMALIAPGQEVQEYRMIMTALEQKLFFYLKGNSLFGKYLAGGEWKELIAEVPLSVVEGVDSFRVFEWSVGLYIFYYTKSGALLNAYGLIIENDYSLYYLNNGKKVVPDGLVEPLQTAPMGNGNLLISYLVPGENQNVLKMEEYNRVSQFSYKFPGYRDVTKDVRSAVFFPVRGTGWNLVTDGLVDNRFVKRIYEFKPDLNSYVLRHDLVIVDDIVSAEKEMIGHGLYQYNTPAGKVVVNIFTGEKMIPEKNYDFAFHMTGLSLPFILMTLGQDVYLNDIPSLTGGAR